MRRTSVTDDDAVTAVVRVAGVASAMAHVVDDVVIDVRGIDHPLRTSTTRSIGSASASRAVVAVTMPTMRPQLSSSGPPENPSVTNTDSTLITSRPTADTLLP